IQTTIHKKGSDAGASPSVDYLQSATFYRSLIAYLFPSSLQEATNRPNSELISKASELLVLIASHNDKSSNHQKRSASAADGPELLKLLRALYTSIGGGYSFTLRPFATIASVHQHIHVPLLASCVLHWTEAH